jgi:hypothetical protein
MRAGEALPLLLDFLKNVANIPRMERRDYVLRGSVSLGKDCKSLHFSIDRFLDISRKLLINIRLQAIR